MRVGVLTTSYPRYPGDYAGSFVADRVAELLAAGHSVDVLAAGDRPAPGEAPPQVDGQPPVDGRSQVHTRLTITRLPVGAGLFYGSGAPEALEAGGLTAWIEAARFTATLAAWARARADGWDAIEAHWLAPSALAASASAPALPRRAYAHSGDVALLERIPLGRALARRLASDGTDLRFVSAELRARFAALAGNPAPRSCGAGTEGRLDRLGSVEALPLPAALFPRRARPDPALRRRLGLCCPTVLAVGRLVPIKGHRMLLHACARAATPDAPRPEVVILGDGPERAALAALASALGLPLRLPGFVPREEVAAWLGAADIFAHSSIRLPNGRSEGAPMAAREALSSGIPVALGADVFQLAGEIRRQLFRVSNTSTLRNDLRGVGSPNA